MVKLPQSTRSSARGNKRFVEQPGCVDSVMETVTIGGDATAASVERDGVRIAYEERGSGKPVLLLEGLGYGQWM